MDRLDTGPGGFDDSDALRSGHIKPAAPLPPRESGKIDLRSLRAFGGVISAAPVPKEVEWKHDDPETGEKVTDKFTVHILRHSYGAMERMVLGEGDRSKGALLIANCVRFGDAGEEVMSYEDAYQLDPGLAAVLMKAINEVNAAKNSPPPMKSGTN